MAPEIEQESETGRWGTEIDGAPHPDLFYESDLTGMKYSTTPSLIIELEDDGSPTGMEWGQPVHATVTLAIGDGTGMTCVRLDHLKSVLEQLEEHVYKPEAPILFFSAKAPER